MDIKKLFTDDDAVSPVIGVILMVAITVILAAVIASFVLGLGNNATNQAPQASFGFDYEADSGATGDGYLTVTHDGGDTLEQAEIYIRGDFGSGAGDSAGDWSSLGGTVSGSNSQIVSGDRAEVDVGNDYDIDVVWESQEETTSSTLASDSGPQA